MAKSFDRLRVYVSMHNILLSTILVFSFAMNLKGNDFYIKLKGKSIDEIKLEVGIIEVENNSPHFIKISDFLNDLRDSIISTGLNHNLTDLDVFIHGVWSHNKFVFNEIFQNIHPNILEHNK